MAQQSVEAASWAPLSLMQPEGRGSSAAPHTKASVNVLSLGFAATAILLSLFLLIALFERFLRPAAAGASATSPPPHAHPLPLSLAVPLPSPSSKQQHLCAPPPCDGFVGISVVMPGHTVPTFIAQPVALPFVGLNDALTTTRPPPTM